MNMAKQEQRYGIRELSGLQWGSTETSRAKHFGCQIHYMPEKRAGVAKWNEL
jgi:hypothetical protein